jgi:hypothetical protein
MYSINIHYGRVKETEVELEVQFTTVIAEDSWNVHGIVEDVDFFYASDGRRCGSFVQKYLWRDTKFIDMVLERAEEYTRD